MCSLVVLALTPMRVHQQDYGIYRQLPGSCTQPRYLPFLVVLPLVMDDGRVRIMVHTNTAPWAGEVIVEAELVALGGASSGEFPAEEG